MDKKNTKQKQKAYDWVNEKSTVLASFCNELRQKHYSVHAHAKAEQSLLFFVERKKCTPKCTCTFVFNSIVGLLDTYWVHFRVCPICIQVKVRVDLRLKISINDVG